MQIFFFADLQTISYVIYEGLNFSRIKFSLLTPKPRKSENPPSQDI